VGVNVATKEVDVGVVNAVDAVRGRVRETERTLLLALLEDIEGFAENEGCLVVLAVFGGFERMLSALYVNKT
jgi:hypothetical protein